MSQPERTDLYFDRDVDDYRDGWMHERDVGHSGGCSGSNNGIRQEHSDTQCLCAHDPHRVAGVRQARANLHQGINIGEIVFWVGIVLVGFSLAEQRGKLGGRRIEVRDNNRSRRSRR